MINHLFPMRNHVEFRLSEIPTRYFVKLRFMVSPLVFIRAVPALASVWRFLSLCFLIKTDRTIPSWLGHNFELDSKAIRKTDLYINSITVVQLLWIYSFVLHLWSWFTPILRSDQRIIVSTQHHIGPSVHSFNESSTFCLHLFSSIF